MRPDDRSTPQSAGKLQYQSPPERRGSAYSQVYVFRHDGAVTVAARTSLWQAALISSVLLFFLAIVLVFVFLPSGQSRFAGMEFEDPGGVYPRIGMAVVSALLCMGIIIHIRHALIPFRIHYSNQKLSWSWPELFTRGFHELRRWQIEQIYSREDNSGDTPVFLVEVVEVSGKKHRLAADQHLCSKDAIYIARLLRGAAGLPKTEQDEDATNVGRLLGGS